MADIVKQQLNIFDVVTPVLNQHRCRLVFSWPLLSIIYSHMLKSAPIAPQERVFVAKFVVTKLKSNQSIFVGNPYNQVERVG